MLRFLIILFRNAYKNFINETITGTDNKEYQTDFYGMLDTFQLEIKGIFQDSSVFGMYTSYMDFDFLKKAYNRPADYANRFCVFFEKRNINQKKLHDFHADLSKVIMKSLKNQIYTFSIHDFVF